MCPRSVAVSQLVLIFTQTKKAAEAAADLYAGLGHSAGAVYGGMGSGEREELLTSFRSGGRTMLAAPRILGEGIDVPEADLGIVLSASSGRRQMIQRMGRVLRLKEDRRHARLVIMYVEDTTEDPEMGAHEGFVDLAWEVAEAAQIFPARSSSSELIDFLNDGLAQ